MLVRSPRRLCSFKDVLNKVNFEHPNTGKFDFTNGEVSHKAIRYKEYMLF